MADYIKYEQSRPADMRRVIAESPVAYVPLGALEWHGEHGPLGLDGLKARALCEACAESTGGVVFPAMYWGAFDTMPFPFTLHFKKRYVRSVIRHAIPQVADFGFKMIVILTGHYPPSLVKLLKRESRRFNSKKAGAFVMGAPETVFATDLDYYGDHAGMWETSIMMALEPGLIRLDALPRGLSTLERLDRGIMGKDPVSRASAEKGELAVSHIASNVAQVVESVLREHSELAIEDAYKKYERTMKILSPRIFHVAREALDVRSVPEFLRYYLKVFRNL